MLKCVRYPISLASFWVAIRIPAPATIFQNCHYFSIFPLHITWNCETGKTIGIWWFIPFPSWVFQILACVFAVLMTTEMVQIEAKCCVVLLERLSGSWASRLQWGTEILNDAQYPSHSRPTPKPVSQKCKWLNGGLFWDALSGFQFVLFSYPPNV